ncbi:MAG: hypothetical protein E2O29_01535 [Deltaproteobacteria bacterium]|nr:MAG: hypothetical protein E2O29_01535 [Deltaproteobacteria bacterium]
MSDVNPWADSPEEKEMTTKTGGNNKLTRLVLEEGENTVRIVGAYKIFNEHWFNKVKRAAVCPGKDCPMCNHPDKTKLFEEGKALRDKGGTENEKQAKSVFRKAYGYEANVRYVVNVIDRKDGGMKVWLFSRTLKETIMKIAEKYGDPTQYDLVVNRTGKKLETKYTVIPERESTPLTEADKKLKTFSLNTIFKPSTVEKVRMLMNGQVPQRETTESKTKESVGVVATEAPVTEGLDDALDGLGDIE